MIKMTIEDQVFELPEALTIEQWQNAIKWDFEDSTYWPHIIHAVTGISLHLLKDVNHDSLELAIVFISAVMQQRKEVPMMDLNKMTFGQWVDLDIYGTFGADKKLRDMMDILYPDCKDAAEALWVLDKYIEFKKFMTRQYKELFGYTEDVPEDVENMPIDPMQAAKSWYKVMVNLANNDVLKLDAVASEPLKKILNFMALQKEEALKERDRQRQQKLKYDLQRTGR